MIILNYNTTSNSVNSTNGNIQLVNIRSNVYDEMNLIVDINICHRIVNIIRNQLRVTTSTLFYFKDLIIETTLNINNTKI